MGRNVTHAYPPTLVPDGGIVHSRPVEFFGADPLQTASYNQAAIQAALSAGGFLTLTTPGAYAVTADTFTGNAAATRLLVGPGVSFTIGGTPVALASLRKFRRREVEVLGWQHTDASKTDTDIVEATLFTLDIDANTLEANSALRIITLWLLTNSAATKRIRARFGGTVIMNVDVTTSNALQHEFILRNRNSLSAQLGNPNNVASFSTFGSNNPQTFSIDFGTAQQLTITGTFPVAGTGTNVMTLQSVIVEHLPGD